MLRWLCRLRPFPAGQRHSPVLVGLGQLLFKASPCVAETVEAPPLLQQQQSDHFVLAVVGTTAAINFILAIMRCRLRGRYVGFLPSLLSVAVGIAAISCYSHGVLKFQMYYMALNCVIYALWVSVDAFHCTAAYFE